MIDFGDGRAERMDAAEFLSDLMVARRRRLNQYEEQTDDQEREARAAYEANPKPKVAICQECREPIIDGNPAGHKVGCKSNQEIEF